MSLAEEGWRRGGEERIKEEGWRVNGGARVVGRAEEKNPEGAVASFYLFCHEGRRNG